MTKISWRDVPMNLSGTTGTAFLCLGLLAAGPAQAAVCPLAWGINYPQSGTCAEVRALAGDRFVRDEAEPIPPNYGYSPVGGTANAIAGSVGADAEAMAHAELGVLRVTAQGTYGGADPDAYASAWAGAAFGEGGWIELPGGTAGDLVNAIVTVDIQGTTVGGAFLTYSHLNFSSWVGGNHLDVGNNFGLEFPNGVYQFQAHVGDEVFFSLGMEVDASGSYISPFSRADYGNSAHLFLDFQEPGVVFNSNSGHDYSTVAAVPAPAGVWMLGTGLAGLGGRRWLRRKISS